jgi:hypothetical protein
MFIKAEKLVFYSNQGALLQVEKWDHLKEFISAVDGLKVKSLTAYKDHLYC